jgi:hypothetical protein
MKRILHIVLLTGCILGMGMGQPAYSAQFNITVPVNLYEMSADVTHVIVKGFLICGINTHAQSGFNVGATTWDDQAGDNIEQRKIVGVGQQIRPINTSTGEFHSSIVLGLNVAQGFFPNNVGGYFYRYKLQVDGALVEPNSEASYRGEGTFQGTLSYYGEFNNPARAGQHCVDGVDFTQ